MLKNHLANKYPSLRSSPSINAFAIWVFAFRLVVWLAQYSTPFLAVDHAKGVPYAAALTSRVKLTISSQAKSQSGGVQQLAWGLAK